MTPIGRATGKFIEQRKLMHQLRELYKQVYPTEWIEALAETAGISTTNEPELLDRLIQLEPEVLQEMLDALHHPEGYAYNRLMEELNYGL